MMFHKSPEFESLPVLDIGKREGHTEYIDFLKWDDHASPVMKGVDCYSRPFLTFQLGLQIVKQDGTEVMKYFPQTFFQRFSKYPENWVGGNTHSVLGTYPKLDHHSFDMIKKLALGERVEIDERHGVHGRLPTSKYYLASYDYWTKMGKTKTQSLTL